MMTKNTILPKCLPLLGIALLGSSLMKGFSPAQAVVWLSSAGMNISAALLLVPLVGLIEAILGVSLLFYPGLRWARIGALLFFVGTVCVRVAALLAGASSDCGCFGALSIPAPLLWSFLIAGILITASSLLPQNHSQRSTRHAKLTLAAAILLVCIVSSPTLLHFPNTQQTSTWQESVAATSDARYLIVGSTDCPHCHALLAQLPPDRLQEIAFLVRQDDRGQLPNPSPRIYRIPAKSWWNALEQAPPALFERSKSPLLHRLDEKQFLERLAR